MSTRRMPGDVIEIDAELVEDRPNAYKIYDGKRTVWLPKSETEHEEGSKVFLVPEWLAKAKGLI